MEQERKCAYCGARLLGRTAKCPVCGRPVSIEDIASPAAPEAEAETYSYSYEDNIPNAGANARSCPNCGSRVMGRSKFCAVCGFELPIEAIESADANNEQIIMPPEPAPEREIIHPTTIEELKLYCEQKGMPLIKMRFFIGMDYKQPRAFGIYRDGNMFIVYKNKDNGQRAIRYSGPDEAFAVNELFQKLLSECHLRGIYPDGAPNKQQPVSVETANPAVVRRNRNRTLGIIVGVIAVIILISILIVRNDRSNRGYYRRDGNLYYRDHSTWYVYDGYAWAYYNGYFDNYDDYYVGYSYDDGYGAYDITDSDIWEETHDSHDSYGGDYDSWDSFDTDWGSDW